jgi:hypothetical protein
VEVTDNSIRIKISKFKGNNNIINIRISSLKEAEGDDQMRKQSYNAITAKSMGTMNLNAGKSKQIISEEEQMCQNIRETPQEVCFSHATKLNNNLKISSCWIVDATCWVCVIFFARVVVKWMHRSSGAVPPNFFFSGRHIFTGPTYFCRANILPRQHISGTT